MAPPVNDNFASAVALSTTLPNNTTGTTIEATEQGTEDRSPPYFGGGITIKSVWYTFTPASTGRYRFVAAPDPPVTGVNVHKRLAIDIASGVAVNALTVLDYDKFDGTGSEPAGFELCSVEATLTASTTYYIRVSSPEFTGEGELRSVDFTLDWEEIGPDSPPANDDIANADDLGTDPTDGLKFSGTTYGATKEADFESFFDYPPSTWHVFETGASGGGSQEIHVTAPELGPFRPYWEVWEVLSDPPADFNDLDFVDSANLHTFPNPPEENWDARGTVTLANNKKYVILVCCWDFNALTGDYELFFGPVIDPGGPPPANDAFANRVQLAYAYKQCVEGTTLDATTEGSEPSPVQPSVWYEYVPPNWNNEPLDIQFDTEGSDVGTDTYIEVYTGSALGSLTLIDSDHNSGAGGKSKVTINSNGDVNYKIRVSSPSSDTGDFKLNISVLPGGSPPANDDWEDAEVLTGYSDTASGTTVGATGQCGQGVIHHSYNDESTNDVWYKWTPPQTGRVRVEISGTDLILSVARGSSYATLVNIGPQFGLEDEFGYLTVEGGEDYYFVVQGNGGAEDTFTLSFEMANVSAPANDEPDNATLLPNTPLGGSISVVTEGSIFDTEGPFAGDFVTNAEELSTIWYKLQPTQDGAITITVPTVTNFNGDFSNDVKVRVYQGDDIATATEVHAGINASPNSGNVGTVNLEAGETYWIAVTTRAWTESGSASFDMLFTSGDVFEPGTGAGVGVFDGTTGGFVYDDEDDEYVASGGVGYGTITPFPTGHNPYGWWCRFTLRSSTGDYLYRYGQTQQYIEVFRATKSGGDYHSLYVMGHRNGYQYIAVGVNGSVTAETDCRVWGAHKSGSGHGRMRIEVGENGVTVDGRNFILPGNIFRDSASDQFVSFDFGIRTYPADGTSYVDLDPEWDMRYSGIKMHDDPVENIMGDVDVTIREVGYLAGWTTGSRILGSPAYPERVASPSHLPTVIPSTGDYDGYSLDCSVSSPAKLNPKGMQWLKSGDNPFHDVPTDGYNPGFSFRFLCDEFPSANLAIASIFNSVNGCFLVLGPDGTLSIMPSLHSDLIPFCYTTEGRWNYFELQADTHKRRYATTIWMDDVPMGTFESTYIPNSGSTDLTNYPLQPAYFNSFKVGRLGEGEPFMTSGVFSDITVGLEFRDIAMTRRKVDRPLGPTVVIGRSLNGVGEHQIVEEDFDTDAVDVAFNNDFSGAPDGAGQPDYWSGYDRADTKPGGAMYLGWLFQNFGDSLITQVADGSGPPGHTGENAMRIEGVTPPGGGDEDYVEAGYIFGNGLEETYDYEYARTLGAQFWIKGEAGQRIGCRATSGFGSYPGYNTHVLTGEWEYVRLYLTPQYLNPGGYGISAFILTFLDAVAGDIFLVKDFHLYVNGDTEITKFFQSPNNGGSTTLIEVGESDSWQLIDEMPPTANADQIFLDTTVLRTKVRHDESDGDTHLPPEFIDDYVEYEFGTTDADRLFGVRILLGMHGYNGVHNIDESEDFTTDTAGDVHMGIANDNGEFKYAGIHSTSDSSQLIWGIGLPKPAGVGEWNLIKWEDAKVRFGWHDNLFTSANPEYQPLFQRGGVITGVSAELLVYDRKLYAPPCKKLIGVYSTAQIA